MTPKGKNNSFSKGETEEAVRNGLPLWIWPTGFVFFLSLFWNITNPQDSYSRRPDAMMYDGIAANLAAGNGYSYDRTPPYRSEITRPPFLPVLAATIYSVFGHSRHLFYFFNALFIATAIALSFNIGKTLFGDERTAFVGSWIAAIAPPVAGSANSVLTEPTAMLLIMLSVYLLLRWREGSIVGLRGIWYGALLGFILSALVLTRTNLTPHVLIASAWFFLATWRLRKQVSHWLLVLIVFSATLGTPVLAWSSRNASFGLSFTPMAAGKGPGYVHEIGRYRELLLDPDEKLPRAEVAFWYHFKTPRGPEEMLQLDRICQHWVAQWMSENKGRWIRAIPTRLGVLFSGKQISTYQSPFSNEFRPTARNIISWISRVLWMLSLVGFLMMAKARTARWIWLGTLGTLVIFSAVTICQPRYLVPTIPLLLPYAAIPIISIAHSIRRRFSFRSSGKHNQEELS